MLQLYIWTDPWVKFLQLGEVKRGLKAYKASGATIEDYQRHIMFVQVDKLVQTLMASARAACMDVVSHTVTGISLMISKEISLATSCVGCVDCHLFRRPAASHHPYPFSHDGLKVDDEARSSMQDYLYEVLDRDTMPGGRSIWIIDMKGNLLCRPTLWLQHTHVTRLMTISLTLSKQ